MKPRKMTVGVLGLFLVLCTMFVCAAEVLFTGSVDRLRELCAGKHVDLMFTARVNLWAVPTYGISALLAFAAIEKWLWARLRKRSWLERGALYALVIFFFEIVWGAVLEKVLGVCPWQYQESALWLWRYVHLPHVVVWIPLGLCLERIWSFSLFSPRIFRIWNKTRSLPKIHVVRRKARFWKQRR